MNIVHGKSYLECTFDEFWKELVSPRMVGETKDDVIKTLQGESKLTPRYRIPGADVNRDIFFNNLELLRRFASFPTPTQAKILASIRWALKEHNAEQMFIEVPWSKTKTRKLLIRASGSNYECLDFEII